MAALAILVVSASPPFEFGGGTTATEARAAEAAWAASSARPAAVLVGAVAATAAAEAKVDVEAESPLLVPAVDAIDGGDGWG